jgi:hypothetical protein
MQQCKQYPQGLLFAVSYLLTCCFLLLAFYDFAGLDAAGADLHALGRAVGKGLHRLKIRVPAPTGDVVRVRDVVTELRAFAAKLTYLCHDIAPNESFAPEETPINNPRAIWIPEDFSGGILPV